MKLKYLLFLVLGVIALSFTVNVNALGTARINPQSGINLRTGPGTNYKVNGTAKYNDTVTILNNKTIKGQGCSGGWYRIKYNNMTRYICSDEASQSTYTVKIKSNGTAVRNGAGTNKSKHTTLSKNTIVTLNGTSKYKGNGCSGGWYKIIINRSWNKYICSNYVTNKNNTNVVTITKSNGAYIKNKTKKSGKNIEKIPFGTSLTLYETGKFSGYQCKSKYYKVFYKGKVRFICSSNTRVGNLSGVITASDGVSIRRKASSTSKKTATIRYGAKVFLASTTKYKGNGCSAGWYKTHLDGAVNYICSSYVSTSKMAVAAKVNTNIKSSNNNSSNNLGTVKSGENIMLASDTRYSGNGCSSGFYKVNYDNRTGYVCSSNTDYISSSSPVKLNATSTSNTTTTTGNKKITKRGNYYTINNWSHRVNEDYAYVRTSSSGSIKDTVYLGTELEVLGTAKSTSNCSSGWYKVKYFTNKTGYICKTYVDAYNSVSKNNSSYCETLKKNGFPASYCPYLSYLHSKHPSWVFKAEKTGVTFDNAVNGEAKKNYTQATKSAYIASSTIAEAGGWRVASTPYVGFMIDPRSYLNEKNIFAFESLSYDKNTQTKSIVRSVLKGSWLDTDAKSEYFMNAARNNNISPVHLAARAKQEGATNKSYAAINGNVSTTWRVASDVYVCAANVNVDTKKKTVKAKYNDTTLRAKNATNSATIKYPNGKAVTITPNDSLSLVNTTKYSSAKGCTSGWYRINVNKSLKGIYNFYNIGSYGSNPVIRGLAAAAGYVDDLDGTPWNSYSKAVNYGAKFIANGYISKGQDTLFYQKFNVGPRNYFNKYTHQYMTNILAPASESLSTYRSYSNMNILNKAYTFKIPVYNSMPTEMSTHPIVK